MVRPPSHSIDTLTPILGLQTTLLDDIVEDFAVTARSVGFKDAENIIQFILLKSGRY